jgi:S-DNA-T family DNA segregation ATPase FtsK/SpoIIIE
VDSGRLVDLLEGLLRRGPAVGLLTVLASDRSGFTHRLSSAISSRLVLRQADRDDYAVFGLNPRDVPRRMPPGRALWATTGEEVQVALLAADAGGGAQAAALVDAAARLRARWDGTDPTALPRRVDPLPEQVGIADLDALRVAPRPNRPAVCTPGVGGDHLGPVDVDLTEAGGSFLVAGPGRSGRSTALLAIAHSLTGWRTGELRLVAICPRPSPLRQLADAPGVLAVLGDTGGALAGELDDALAAAAGPVALFVDDGELLTDGPVGARLEGFVRETRDSDSLLVAAATTEDLLMQRFRGWLNAARRSRSGMLLDPTSHLDGDVFDLRLPRSTAGGWPPGRALLVLHGAASPVQVPSTTAHTV